MVSVKVFSLQEESIEETTNEVAALQWITSSGKESHHLQRPVLIGKDATHIYIISPYHKEESLFDYCGRVGRLSESEARFFFRQILQVSIVTICLELLHLLHKLGRSPFVFIFHCRLPHTIVFFKGLEDLKDLEICHRGLDLDSILLKGKTCIFSNFEHALRIPASEGQNALINSQEPHGKNPQSVAPELLKSEPFDGNAVDLWSAGVILFQMLLGCIALFDAPIAEDSKYDEICARSDLKGALQRWMPDEEHPLSAEAIDLLERMLKAEPQKRLTLSGVQNHPWVTADRKRT
jgi:serine/threonine protein kinase